MENKEEGSRFVCAESVRSAPKNSHGMLSQETNDENAKLNVKNKCSGRT